MFSSLQMKFVYRLQNMNAYLSDGAVFLHNSKVFQYGRSSDGVVANSQAHILYFFPNVY